MTLTAPALDRLSRAARQLANTIDEFGTVTDPVIWSALESAMAAATIEGITDVPPTDPLVAMQGALEDAENRALSMYNHARDLEGQLEQALKQSAEDFERLRPEGAITAGSPGHHVLRWLMTNEGYGATRGQVQAHNRAQVQRPEIAPGMVEHTLLDLCRLRLLEVRDARLYVTLPGRMLAYRLGPVDAPAVQP